jgi:dolichyl-phosphate-mannose-protein mannosyltransferase
MNRSYTLGYKKSLKPLFLSGIFLGIGAASKWIGLYAAAGLAFLFFVAKYNEYREYDMVTKSRKIKKPAWYKDFIPVYIWQTLAMCIVFFVIIPAIIYILSYIPYAMAEAHNGRSMWSVIWENQSYMYGYHKGVTQSHPFQSNWWQWPVMYRPMWYYNNTDLPAGISSTISAMGNLAVWWVGIITFLLGGVTALYKKHKYMLIVYTAAACQYFVWILITRTVYIYHFYSTVPFMIFTIVYMMKCMIDMYNDPARAVKIGRITLMMSRKKVMIWLSVFYLVVVAAMFILFYPAISGFEVSTKWIKALKWFSTWPL